MDTKDRGVGACTSGEDIPAAGDVFMDTKERGVGACTAGESPTAGEAEIRDELDMRGDCGFGLITLPFSVLAAVMLVMSPRTPPRSRELDTPQLFLLLQPAGLAPT